MPRKFDFDVRTLLPRTSRFADLHPALRIEFVLNDEKQDLVGDAVNVALRVGELADSSTVARKIGTVPRTLAASPAYLATAGVPKEPAELTKYTLIGGPAGESMRAWVFKKNGKSTSIRIEGCFMLSGGEGAIAAAVARSR